MRHAPATAAGLEIETIRISAPFARPAMKGTEDWYRILITVRNTSKAQTYHVIDSLRWMDYDAASQTLLVHLLDPPPAPPSGYSRVFSPTLTEVAPGATETLTVSVPKVIKKIHPSRSGGLGNSTERIDISGLKQVQCRIGYSDSPFPIHPSESTQQMRARLQEWARVAEKTMSPGPAESD